MEPNSTAVTYRLLRSFKMDKKKNVFRKMYDYFEQNPNKRIILLLIPAIYVILFTVIFSVNCLYWDNWAIAEYVEYYYNGELTLNKLIAPHDYHIIPVTKLIQVGLGVITGVNTWAFSFVTLLLLLSVFILLFVQAKKDFQFDMKSIPLWIIPITFFLVSGRHEGNLLNGWVGFILPLTLTILSFFITQKMYELAIDNKAALSLLWIIPVIIFAFIASFTHALGLFLWIPLLLQIILQKKHRFKWLKFGILLGAGIATWILYFDTLPQSPIGTDFPVFTIIGIFFGILGNFIGDVTTGIILGIGIFAAFIFLVYQIFKNKEQSKYAFWIALGVYGLLIAGSIAMIRHEYGIMVMLWARYATYGMIFITATYMLMPAFKPKKRIKLYSVIRIIVLIAGILISLAEIYEGVRKRVYQKQNQPILLNYENATDEELIRTFPDPQFVRDRCRFLEENNLHLFAHPERYTKDE